MDAVAVEMQLLLIDRNENLLRPFRDSAERVFALGLGGRWFVRFVPGSMFVCAAGPTAIPISRRRRRWTRGDHQTCRDGKRANGAAGTANPPRRCFVVWCARNEQFRPQPP